MSFRTTLVLLIVLAALTAAYLFTPARDGVVASPNGEPAPGALTSLYGAALQVDDIVRIAVDGGDEQIVFERSPADDADEPGTWRMQAPAESATEKWKVDGLVRALANLKVRTRLEPDAADSVSRADAGLEPPWRTVELALADGATHRLEIGARAPLSEDAYVRLGDDAAIYVVDRDLRTELERESSYYRSRNVLSFERDDVQAVTATVGASEYKLRKSPAGDWSLDAPVQALADKDAVRDYLNQLKTVRVAEFVDAPTGGLGFEAPELTLEIETFRQQDATPEDDPNAERSVEIVRDVQRLEIGAAADLDGAQRYARLADAPGVFTLASSALDQLRPDLTKLRDNRVLRMTEDQMDVVALDVGGERGMLEQVSDRWVGRLQLDPVDRAAADEFVATLAELRAVDFLDDPGPLSNYGLDEPRATVRIESRNLRTRVTLLIGDHTASGRNAFAQILDEPTVYVIGAAQADVLAAPPLALRSRDIFDFASDDVQRLSVTRDGRALTLERADAVWRFVEPAGWPVDDGAVATLVSDLAGLRAARVVSTAAPTTQPADAHGVLGFEIVLAPDGPSDPNAPAPPAPQTLALTAYRSGGAALARKGDEPFLYELDDSVYDVLAGELIERRLWQAAASEIVGYRVSGPDLSLELRKTDDGWQFPADPYVKIDADKVRQLVDTLAQLKAQQYLAYEDADLAALGLANAPFTVAIELMGDRTITLQLEQQRVGELERRAAWLEQQRAFTLMFDDVAALLKPAEHYFTDADGE